MALAVKVILLGTFMLSVEVQLQSTRLPERIGVVMLDSADGQCPSTEDRETAFNSIREQVQGALRDNCGNQVFGWRQIAFYNMSASNYNCPSGLKLTSRTNAKRLCKPNLSGRCSSTLFPTQTKYSQVCGRIIGYQVGSTSAFWGYGNGYGLDTSYVEGVSLTHGVNGARTHIWTFASGIEETTHTTYSTQRCPCDTSNSAVVSPTFVGNDYFCESGWHAAFKTSMYNHVFLDNPLWDGQNCTSTSTCCEFNNPPWFTKTLRYPTTDDVEMRVCVNQARQETNLLELIELYVR